MRRFAVVLVLACGCREAGNDDRKDSGIASLSSDVASSTIGGSESPIASDSEPTSEATVGTSPDGTADGGPKLDLGIFPDLAGADETDGAVPPPCDNIEDFPSTSVGCEFWAAQVPSSGSALPYGISVGNPGMVVANVVIEDMLRATS